ncbi:P-loop containing nucleoside triphosphate hydrolase [Pseudocohnilembus persalinus]|uniref:p-loop containing nucleoside triphosphate hydrolase n=1 Tax=Pseudocohnilembus persalinus TaxID=266149 RepID=A0A0V0QSU9_PSEPJ|nr:P-loop containing nucleoside triphosphate hydrolase [Pseudocohnilembus persalinus]|eukprot:KRX05245.1 P-loop containing nucleoside triphosphate hydrolase [Pseudocohnilembus persalinus]
MINKDAENIQVMVRVRPLNQRERDEGAQSCVIQQDGNTKQLVLQTHSDQKTFNFDYVTDNKVTQDDIFHIVGKPITDACLEGYNACIFAYGQTGAGKTFTMQGKNLDEGRDNPNRGLQPRVFDYLFGLINQIKKQKDIEYLVKCSYLEIYNEQIKDLLSSEPSTQMNVREDIKKGVYVENLTEEEAQNGQEAIDLLIKGACNRHVGATKMNAESSRSHSVFSIAIQSKQIISGLNTTKGSKLHFVDLAGSERQKQTQAEGSRLKEAANINKSLTVLGIVINTLVENSGGKSRHVPYRDSKLTFILKDSLGGNSRTFMIAAISAANTSFPETLSTLKFAQRAKQIKNNASINEESSGNVEAMKKEIKKLKQEIEDYKVQIKGFQQNPENFCKENENLNQNTVLSQENQIAGKVTPNIVKASQGKYTPKLGSNRKNNYQNEVQILKDFTQEWNEKLSIFTENIEKSLKNMDIQMQKQQSNNNKMEVEQENNQSLFDQSVVSESTILNQDQKESCQINMQNLFDLKQTIQNKIINLDIQFSDPSGQMVPIETLQTVQEEIKNLMEEVESYKQENLEISKNYQKSLESQKKKFEDDLNSKYQNKDEMEKQLWNSNIKLEELSKEKDFYQKQTEKLNNQINQFDKKQLELEDELKNNEQELMRLSKEKLNLQESVINLEKQINDEKDKSVRQNSIIDHLQQENQGITLEKMEIQENYDKICEENSQFLRKIEDMDLEILNLNEQIDIEKEKYLSLNQENKRVQEELDTFKESYEFCETQLEKKSSELKSLQNELTNYQIQITEIEKSSSEKIDQIQSELNQYLISFQNTKQELENVSNQLSDQINKYQILESEKDYFKQENQKKIQQIDKLEKNNQLVIELYEENKQKQEIDLQNIQSQIGKQQLVQQILEKEKEKLVQEVIDLKSDIQELELDKQTLNTSLKNQTILNQELQDQIQQVIEDLNQTTTQILQISEQNLNQQEKNINLEEQVQKIKNELVSQEEQWIQQENQLNEIISLQNDKHQNLMNTINEQASQINESHTSLLDKNNELNILKEQKMKNKQQIQDLLQNSQLLGQNNQDLQKQIKQQKEQLENKSLDITRLKEQMVQVKQNELASQYEQNMQESSEKIIELQKKLDQNELYIENQRKQYQEELDKLKNMIKQLEIVTSQTNYNQSQKIKFTELEAKLQKQEAIHNNLLNEKAKELAQVKNQLRTIMCDKKTFQNTIDQQTKQLQRLSQENKELLEKVNQSKITRQLSGDKGPYLQKDQLTEKDEQIQSLNEKIAEMEQQQEFALIKIQQSKSEIQNDLKFQQLNEDNYNALTIQNQRYKCQLIEQENNNKQQKLQIIKLVQQLINKQIIDSQGIELEKFQESSQQQIDKSNETIIA